MGRRSQPTAPRPHPATGVLPQARRTPSTLNTYTASFRTEGTEDEHLQDKKAITRANAALGPLQTSFQAEPKGSKSLSSPCPGRPPEPPSLRGELPSAHSRPGSGHCAGSAGQVTDTRYPCRHNGSGSGSPGTGPARPPGTRSLQQTSASGARPRMCERTGTPPPRRPSMAVPLCAQRMGRGKGGQRLRAPPRASARPRPVTENLVLSSSLRAPSKLASHPVTARHLPQLPPGMCRGPARL
ncbi:AN1-type zinc finger protein 3 isoform X1 [Oenanthe melanoleuca]|uniref:AN1-type zinc finger protein 3 isoform X1 n=1 Tax=Oenanthe melanoleuca TaxID=2939378 RepID=UPI0024C18F9A|nr:AN1-type zinc finger protein 3 isoform X1 [Oenanthe melanoleuca]